MIRCKKCKSILVKVFNLNFAKRKLEGQAASKIGSTKKQFLCQSCSEEWFFDPNCEKLYFEYLDLKPETTLVAHNMGSDGTYEAQYIDPNKLMRRLELARELIRSYQHMLDIGPDLWLQLSQDAGEHASEN